jgi:hypothetical protein
MTDQPSPRRWFQFRLRTLMIVVTFLAIICAVGVPLVREWLKPEPLVEPWLPADVFTNTTQGTMPAKPIQPRPGAPVPVSAPPNYKPPEYKPATEP